MKKIKKDRKEMLRNKKIYLAGIIITAIAAAVPLLLFQEHKKDTDSIEKFIKKYLAEYQPVCQEEVQMLSKELDSIIENQVPAGTPLSEDEKNEIIQAVCAELERATYSIPEQEIREIAYQIIENSTGQEMPEKSMQHQEEKANPEKEIQFTALGSESNITGKDVRRIASSLDWTEEEIANLIRENLSVTDKTLKDMAEILGISIHELNRIIAENREYTDSLYLSIADALSMDASQLKALAEQAENSAEGISYLAKILKITEGKLNAEIAKSKAFSSSEIEALAHELQMSSEDLQKLIWQHMVLTDDNISKLSYELSIDIENFRKQTGETFSALEEEMGEGIRRLEEADQTLIQNMAEASAATKAGLEETKDSLQGMIESNHASITATGQALQEAKEAFGQGFESMQGNLAAQEAKADQQIGDIHNRISRVQGTMETYQWNTDASGNTKLTVTIPREEEDPS